MWFSLKKFFVRNIFVSYSDCVFSVYVMLNAEKFF